MQDTRCSADPVRGLAQRFLDDTPVRTDSVATIESQGVTGVSFVGISAGTPEAERLLRGADGSVPEIPAGQSVLQTLSEDAPALLQESLDTVRELNAVLGGENRGREQEQERGAGEVEGALEGAADAPVARTDHLDQRDVGHPAVAHAPDEALEEGVLLWLARRDVAM